MLCWFLLFKTMRKKKILFFIILLLVFFVSGCGQKESFMDKPSEDGKYYYKNKDLGFSLVLPEEFVYYQTQRKETNNFIDIEIFIPTSDNIYSQEVFGYAKPLVIRIFNFDYWQSVSEEDLYHKLGEDNNKVYTVKFWDKIPVDWEDKWTEDLKSSIISNFNIIK